MAKAARRHAPQKVRKAARYGPAEWFMAALGLAMVVLVVALVVGAIVG